MLKHLTILCLLFVVANQSKAQINLVPNPSFEDYYVYYNGNSPIVGIADSNYAFKPYNWYAVNGSPDLYTYYNRHSGPNFGCLGEESAGADIPSNWAGFQYPRTDSCYLGLAWFNFIQCPTCGFNFLAREWAGTRLVDTLRKGQCYRFSMYVSLAEICGYNVSSLGAYFSKDSLFTGIVESTWVTTFPMPFDSVQVYQNPDSAIWDTTNWVQITGVFEAKGGETFLTIGHLLQDSLSNPIPIYPNVDDEYCGYSYFFIDDVSLYETNEPCKFVGVNEIKKEDIKIFPNPAAENVTITLPPNTNKAELLVYTVQGQLLSQQQISGSQTINTSNFTNGLYLFVIQLNGNIIGREKAIIAH